MRLVRVSYLVPLILFGAMSLPLAFFGATCNPKFPFEQQKPMGWQGADAAYSIPLPDGRVVWIFGDTLYGEKRIVHGNDPQMTHNSLGISTCDANGKWNLQYVIKRVAEANAESYFSPKNPQHWYWAMDGFVADGDLWVTLLCVRHPLHSIPGAMDFETCGADLAQIRHLNRDPQQWEVTYHRLVDDGLKAYPSASAVVDGDYVYIFALYETGSKPLLATRIALRGLNSPKENLEYFAEDGTWKHGFEPIHAKEIMHTGSTELSIRYHSDLGKWLAILVEPGTFSDKIILRAAPKLTGPWVGDTVVYRIPELQPGPEHDKNTFCYAGKEHPEFESRNDLVFTYVCNTFDVPTLATNYKIYFPQVVRIPMPGLEGH
jgi:Domain of unknown function (DUF4185)